MAVLGACSSRMGCLPVGICKTSFPDLSGSCCLPTAPPRLTPHTCLGLRCSRDSETPRGAASCPAPRRGVSIPIATGFLLECKAEFWELVVTCGALAGLAEREKLLLVTQDLSIHHLPRGHEAFAHGSCLVRQGGSGWQENQYFEQRRSREL